MKQAVYIVYVLIFISTSKISFAQTEVVRPDSLIQELTTLLFNPNHCGQEDSIEIVEFRWRDSLYRVSGPYCKEDYESARDILREMRLHKNATDTIALLDILFRYEHKFINEWEPTWRAGHKYYEWQYDVLMGIELTIASLRISTDGKSKQSYNYLKNLHAVQWGDGGDLSKCKFYSKYVNDKWKGACIASYFCSTRLILEKGTELGAYMLSDIDNMSPENLQDWEKNYYRILVTALRKYPSREVEEVIVRNIEKFNDLPAYTIEIGRPLFVYSLLGARGDSTALAFLIDELSDVEILLLKNSVISRITLSDNGKRLLSIRLAKTIQRVQNKSEYVALLTEIKGQRYLDKSTIKAINRTLPRKAHKIPYSSKQESNRNTK